MFRRTVVLYQTLIIFIFGLMIMSCVPYLEPEAQPLPAGFIDEENRLVEEVWQLVEVIQQEEVINFTTIAPIKLIFSQEGILGVLVTDCNSYSLKVIVEPDEEHYQLFSGTSTAIDCGELRQFQTERVGNALRSTNRYEIQGDRLILIGEGVQLVLDPDFKNVFRGEYANLTQYGSWYLVEATHNQTRISFESIAPIIINFERVTNWLHVQTTDCASIAYQFIPDIERSYHSMFDDISILPGCNEAKRSQVAQVKSAVEATTRFRFEGDQLHLLGDGVAVILAPEPIPSNTSPSTSPVATPTTP